MPVIVDPDQARARRLLGALPQGSRYVDSADRLLPWLAKSPDVDVVVLGPTVEFDTAIAVCESLRAARPTTSVVLVREAIDADVLAKAMQAGAREVVADDDLSSVAGAVHRGHQLAISLRGPDPVARNGTVVTVFAPKGGVGKTTIAVNLALALADRGRRRVCLVDLDLAFGDVAITLQLFPAHTIEHAIGSETSIDASLLGSLLTRYHESLLVLPAPNTPDARERITPGLIASTLRTLRTMFDYVVVDTAPTFDEQTLTALEETDECVLVATLDVPALKNVKLALETLELLDLGRGQRHLVLNRADDAVGLTAEQVESILGASIASQIPTSHDVATATNAGTPIVATSAHHCVSAAFRDLATLITGDHAKPVITGPGRHLDSSNARSTRLFRIRR